MNSDFKEGMTYKIGTSAKRNFFNMEYYEGNTKCDFDDFDVEIIFNPDVQVINKTTDPVAAFP